MQFGYYVENGQFGGHIIVHRWRDHFAGRQPWPQQVTATDMIQAVVPNLSLSVTRMTIDWLGIPYPRQAVYRKLRAIARCWLRQPGRTLHYTAADPRPELRAALVRDRLLPADHDAT